MYEYYSYQQREEKLYWQPLKSTDLHIFELPDYKPDVLITVFGKRIHAHSIILKIKSAYFRAFMDKYDPPGYSRVEFHYEYNTVVDEDGFWALEKVRAPWVDTTHKFQGSKEDQGAAFVGLLQAMYGRRYRLEKEMDLVNIVNLADYYCAIPVLSHSMSAAIVSSRFFDAQALSDKILIAAQKIRNPELFKECIIYWVAYYVKTADPGVDCMVLSQSHEKNLEFLRENHPDVYAVIKKAYIGVGAQIKAAEARVMGVVNERGTGGKHYWEYMKRRHPGTSLYNFLALVYEDSQFPWKKRSIPEDLMEFDIEDGPDDDYNNKERAVPEYLVNFCRKMCRAIVNLMEDNRFFHKHVGPNNKWDNRHKRCFCAEITNEDLPWNVNQVDW